MFRGNIAHFYCFSGMYGKHLDQAVWRMIIWLVYKAMYKFSAPDTDENRSSWGDTEVKLFLCSLELVFHFYYLSIGGEADSLDSPETRHKSHPQHTYTDTHPPPPSSILHDQHVSPVVWSGKNGSKSENHKSHTGYSSAPKITTSIHVQAHVRIHTSQTELSGLCSHQCVHRKIKTREIVEGVRLSN